MKTVDKLLKVKELLDSGLISRKEFEMMKKELFSTKKVIGTPIDLGLPSGTRWSSCNIGATSPEDIGDIFLTGIPYPVKHEKEGVYEDLIDRASKLGFEWPKLTFRSNGILSFDTAEILWGDQWSTPTGDEVEEMKKYCVIEIISNNVKVIGPNGNYILIPFVDEMDFTLFHTSSQVKQDNKTYNETYSASIDIWPEARILFCFGLSDLPSCHPIRPVCRK